MLASRYQQVTEGLKVPCAMVRVLYSSQSSYAAILKGKPMSALFILILSGLALVQFAVAQWRAIWISAASQPLSDALQSATGMDEATVEAQQFGALIALCDKLLPGLHKSIPWLREISLYYSLVARLERTFPSFSWAKREMATCSRYVAVVLSQSLTMQMDRHLASQHN